MEVIRCSALVFFWLVSEAVFALNCDSLFAHINTIEFGSPDERGKYYVEQGIILGNSNKGECGLHFFDQAIAILKDSVQILRAICIKGMLLANLGRYNEVIETLTPLIPFCERHRPFETPTYLNWIFEGIYDCLASSYLFTGDYRSAIQAAQTSIELGHLFPDKMILEHKYVDFGLIFYKLRDYEKAEEMYRLALTYAKGRNGDVSLIYSNFAACYSEMGSLDTALLYSDSAVHSCKGECDARQKVFNHFNYGMIYLKMSRPDSALRHFETSLRFAEELHFLRMIADNLTYRARIHFLTGIYHSASYDLEIAERIALNGDLNENLLDIFRQAVKLYSETDDFVKLSQYQKKLIAQKAKVHHSEVARDMALMEWRLAEAENHQKRIRQDQKIRVQNEILTNQERLTWSGSLVVGLIVLLIGIVSYQYYDQRRVHIILNTRINQRHICLAANEKSMQLSALDVRRKQEVLNKIIARMSKIEVSNTER